MLKKVVFMLTLLAANASFAQAVSPEVQRSSIISVLAQQLAQVEADKQDLQKQLDVMKNLCGDKCVFQNAAPQK